MFRFEESLYFQSSIALEELKNLKSFNRTHIKLKNESTDCRFKLHSLEYGICEEQMYRLQSNFETRGKELIDVNCHFVSVNVNKGCVKQWINQDVIKAGNELKNLFWLKKMNNNALSDLYKVKKEEYKLLLERTKNNLYNIKNCDKQKEIWSLIRANIGRLEKRRRS
ncbi:hypothetical protein HHI36_023024 [Cryptolaemus montrouzieri]|uniref:Uncharacterized protein n=1 Tax=Cryptolaemus montrouzieri TaxID=559131 RepID=A0ABD2PF79_9CUCU